MANVALAATANRPSTAYKAVPERSTSAISSGLNRLFGTSAMCEETREGEVSAATQQEKARGLDSVRRELTEYLGDPVESFTRIETVDGIERVVIFDIITYWQVRNRNSPAVRQAR